MKVVPPICVHTDASAWFVCRASLPPALDCRPSRPDTRSHTEASASPVTRGLHLPADTPVTSSSVFSKPVVYGAVHVINSTSLILPPGFLAYMPACPPACLSACLPVCLPACLSACTPESFCGLLKLINQPTVRWPCCWMDIRAVNSHVSPV